MLKLYIVAREDLPPGLQAAQAVHGAIEFLFEHPELGREWYRTSKTIVLLGVANEVELRDLAARSAGAGIPVAVNLEPDLDGQATSLALMGAPPAKRILRPLPLLLSAEQLAAQPASAACPACEVRTRSSSIPSAAANTVGT